MLKIVLQHNRSRSRNLSVRQCNDRGQTRAPAQLRCALALAFNLIGKLIWIGLWDVCAIVVVTVTYHDLRVVKEGIDIEQIAVAFD